MQREEDVQGSKKVKEWDRVMTGKAGRDWERKRERVLFPVSAAFRAANEFDAVT